MAAGLCDCGCAVDLEIDGVGQAAGDGSLVDVWRQHLEDAEDGQEDSQEDVPVDRHGGEPPARC